MTAAPLSPPRCVCQATSATDSTAAEHEKWCPSRKPTPERLAELKSGTGRPLMDGELEELRGDANRSELHVIGARGGHWSLTDDLPGAVLELARELGAMVAEVDRMRPALNESENDLTGARLSLREEEQDAKRLRVALESAKRGRRDLRAELYTAQAHGRTFMEQRNKHARELLELRKRVAALEAERHATNELPTAAVERVAELTKRLPAARPESTRPPVALNSPAALLARRLTATRADAVSVTPVDATTLTVDVIPATLRDWDWWLVRLHIPAGTVTHRGSYATAKGAFGRVHVVLTGHGVGALYAAERDAATGGAR